MLLSCCDHFDKCKENKDTESTTEQKEIQTKVEEEVKNEKFPNNAIFMDSSIAVAEGNKEPRQKSDSDICFLCMKPSDKFYQSCLLPYCSQAHYDLHTITHEDMGTGELNAEYCFPFRVLQRPEVRIANRKIN